jgi:hypothetical protein
MTQNGTGPPVWFLDSGKRTCLPHSTAAVSRRQTIPNFTLTHPFAKNAKAWGTRQRAHRCRGLLAQAELLDDGGITYGIVLFEIVEQATPLADQHEKTAARAVVLQVHFEVFRQLTNALAQQRDLDFGTARVGGMCPVPVNEGFLLLSG